MRTENPSTGPILQLVSAEELARRWRVHPSTVRRQLRAAGILPVRIGRACRYPIDEVQRFLRENSPPPRGRRPLV